MNRFIVFGIFFYAFIASHSYASNVQDRDPIDVRHQQILDEVLQTYEEGEFIIPRDTAEASEAMINSTRYIDNLVVNECHQPYSLDASDDELNVERYNIFIQNYRICINQFLYTNIYSTSIAISQYKDFIENLPDIDGIDNLDGILDIKED